MPTSTPAHTSRTSNVAPPRSGASIAYLYIKYVHRLVVVTLVKMAILMAVEDGRCDDDGNCRRNDDDDDDDGDHDSKWWWYMEAEGVWCWMTNKEGTCCT